MGGGLVPGHAKPGAGPPAENILNKAGEWGIINPYSVRKPDDQTGIVSLRAEST